MRRRELMLLLGGAMAAPRALRAQHNSMPVIGFLGAASPGPFARELAAFRDGLRKAGRVEGQNVAIDYRWAEGRVERLDELAAALVALNVGVITTSGGTLPALAAKRATSTIPIVFETGGDPVEEGLVASYAHPGGNLTGVTIVATELNPKRLELLTELVPGTGTIALLVDLSSPSTPQTVHDVEGAARAMGRRLDVVNVGSPKEFEPAFAALARLKPGALMVANSAVFFARRKELVALVERHAVPAVYASRGFVEAGGLIGYGTNIAGMYRVVGGYVGRILAGARPADLPVQQPTIFELVVNLKTAQTLGLRIPPSILARADEVID